MSWVYNYYWGTTDETPAVTTTVEDTTATEATKSKNAG